MAIEASVILPHYNRSEIIGLTLAALNRQTISPDRFEVILVDDGSTDEWQTVIQNLDFSYSLKISQQNNLGPGPARNRGAALAQAALLVFLDADMVPDERLLEEYLATHATQPRAAIIGRQQLHREAYPEEFAEIYTASLASDQGSEPITPVFFALASGNFAIDRVSFSQLGGFDESLRMTEDVDLGYRAYLEKIPILYNPQAIGYHHHLKTLEQIYQQFRLSAAWTARLMEKHPEMHGMIPVYEEDEPIAWKKDGIKMIRKKASIRLLANPLGIRLLAGINLVLSSTKLSVRAQRYAHFITAAIYRYLGFSQGIAKIDRSV